MPTLTPSITDTQILSVIRTSRLDDRQKTELSALAPNMTEAEREELMTLVGEANTAFAKAEAEKNARLAALDAQYDQKLRTAVREETNHIRKEAEAFDQKGIADQVSALELEMKAPHLSPKSIMGLKNSSPVRHVKRNFFLALLTLFTFAGVILYVISKL